MKSNVIINGVTASVAFILFTFVFFGFILSLIISVLFGTIVACTTLIINYINKLREEVYQLKRQNEIFESKYFKQLENEKRV